MDVDSLLCLNSDEKKSFELLKVEKKKSLNEILKDLEESIDCAVHDTGEDVRLNCEKISNFNDRNNSSAAAFGHLINVVSSTLEDLKDISEKKKINDFHQNECAELIVLADSDQYTLEDPVTNPNLQEDNEISRRYPELFEIFSENSMSQFSNFSLSSESESWSRNNVTKHYFTDEKPEKFVGNSLRKFGNSQQFHVNHLNAKVRSDQESTLQDPIMGKNLHQEISSRIIKEDIVPEKLSSINFPDNPEISGDFFGELTMNYTNSKEMKIPTKRKKCDDEWNVYESQSSSKMKKISSSLENVPPLSSTSVFSPRTDASSSSLNSWRTLRDTPRSNNENHFSGFSFFSRSIHEVETDSKFTKSKAKREKLKLKSGDRNKVKKKKKLSSNLETVQGDIEVKLKEDRILTVNSDTKVNNKLIEKIKGEKEQEDKNIIFMDVMDIFVAVKAVLFENRKLVESIQRHFQDCSVFHTIISDDAITLLNEGILRCTMRIQSKGKIQDLFVGANELLMDSVLNLKEAVKEEKEYLKQQEYYYCKHFLGLTKDNRNTGNLKRNTKHTLIGNDTLLSSSQKDRIEQLINYSVSLIKRIIPKNLTTKKEALRSPRKMSPNRNPVSQVRIENESQTQVEISLKPKDYLSFGDEGSLLRDFQDQTNDPESNSKIDPFNKRNPLVSLKSINTNSNSEKLTTGVLHGSCNNSKQFSSQVIKATNKGRSYNNTQPIWKPAGNAKGSFPTQPISRQNTRLIISTLDKKKDKQNDGLTRNPLPSRNIESKKSFKNSISQIQRSTTNLRSYDLVRKPDMKFSKGDQNEENARLISKHSEKLAINQDHGKGKRRSKQSEAIKMLKELIRSTSEEEEEEDKTSPKGCETSECDIEVSVRYLNSRNKSDSSRSSFASTMIIKPESVNHSKLEISQQESNTLEESSKNFLSSSSVQSKRTLSSDTFIMPNTARVPKTENSVSKSSIKSRISSARVENSKSKISVNRNQVDGKTGRNASLNSLRSRELKTKPEDKEVRKPYLRKNANDSSYLESYIKLNSRQSPVSNNSCKSFRERSEVKKGKSKNIPSNSKTKVNTENEEKILEDKLNIQEEQKISQSSCQLLTKVSSSKYCQVSLEPSISSRPSDIEVFEIEINSSDSVNQSSEMFIGKRDQFINKSKKSFLSLKGFLQQHGLNVDLVDETERKLSMTQKGSFTSILLDKGKGTIVAICSSQTLFDKLTSLSDSSLEALEIKNAMNQCSLESFDEESVLESQEYFRNSETSLGSESATKSGNSVSICMRNRRDVALSPKEKVDVFSQTDSCPNKSEDCQTVFTKSVETATEKILFENLVYTDVEVSCDLEDIGVSRKEDSTEISFKTCNCEGKSQMKVNPENSTNSDSYFPSLEKDTNVVQNMVTDRKENLEILEISNKNENNSEDAFLKHEKLLEFSLINTSAGEKINNRELKIPEIEENSEKRNKSICEGKEELSMSREETYQEQKFLKIKKNSEMDNKNLCKVGEEFSSVNSAPYEKIVNEDKLSSTEEESKEENKNACQIKTELSSVNSISRKRTDKQNIEPHEDFEDKKNVKIENLVNDSGKEKKRCDKRSESCSKLKKKVPSIQSDEGRLKKLLNSVLKEIATKSETLLKETEVMKSVEKNHKTPSRISNHDSFSELKVLSVKIPKTKLTENFDEEIPSRKYSSRSEVTETIQNFETKSNSSMKLISKLKHIPSFVAFWDNNKKECKIKMETNKNEVSKSKRNIVDLENYSENCKKIEITGNFFSTKRRTSQKCKSCGKKRRSSSNLSCPLEVGISETSELFKTRNQDLTSTETAVTENNSLPTVIKYDDSKIQKFTVNSTNRLSQSLAVATLKLATNRAQNLYKDVVLCRQCLTSRYSRDLDTSESNSFKEQKNYHFHSKRNYISNENCLGLENLLLESNLDFLPIDVSKIKSKTLRKCGFLTTKENLCVNYKKEKRGDKISKFQLGNEIFSKSFPFVIVGTVCFLILWYFFIRSNFF